MLVLNCEISVVVQILKTYVRLRNPHQLGQLMANFIWFSLLAWSLVGPSSTRYQSIQECTTHHNILSKLPLWFSIIAGDLNCEFCLSWTIFQHSSWPVSPVQWLLFVLNQMDRSRRLPTTLFSPLGPLPSPDY